MISIGKKIISAFVDDPVQPQDRPDDRFAGHFDKLLSQANIPGPDYYEFARMIAVMQAIPDETARYNQYIH
jgi:hypothetical protein